MINANILPFIREIINYGSYPLSTDYYVYVIGNNLLYLIISILGYIFFTNDSEFKSIKGESKKVTYACVLFLVIYAAVNLISFNFNISNFKASFNFSTLLMLEDIFFLLGLVLALLQYRVSLILLVISQLLNSIVIIYYLIEFNNYYSNYPWTQILSLIISILFLLILVKSCFFYSNK